MKRKTKTMCLAEYLVLWDRLKKTREEIAVLRRRIYDKQERLKQLEKKVRNYK